MAPPSVSDSELSRLCCLINDSLHPFTESEKVSLSKEEEKTLLLILSQVSNEIHRLIETSSTSSPLIPFLENNQILSKAISHLIGLLTLESRFVQHLAGNVVVNLSEYIASSGKSWELLVHSLCICFAFSISNISSSSFEPSTPKFGGSDSDLSSPVVLFKPRFQNASLFTVAGITRILRNILKFLKEKCDDELVQVFFKSIHLCILNLPWDSMDDIFGGNGGEEDELRILFLGNFLQFLCSLVDQFSFVEGLDDSLDKHVILSKIINLVPKLLLWCLGKKGECVNTCISRYFRHKLLVLMIRLSFQIPLDYSVLVSWLQLLHDYFQELLCQPLTKFQGEDDCLEDSPFVITISDEDMLSMHSSHLQRQAIFIFLRCTFSLINLRKDNGKHCTTLESSLGFDTISDLSFYGRKKGLLELYTWLSEHLPVDMLMDHEIYTKKCINFSLSFLKLFPEERLASQAVTKDVLFHVSNIFNPIHLFHLFIAELHYDHQVLLDYLISKDVGMSFAEYLLRCLRIVCDSWQIFTEFSVYDEVENQSSKKRRKLLSESSELQIEPSLGSEEIVPLLPEKKLKGDVEYRTGKQAYKQAKDCLLSLKSSVENLHFKNLFPYNPEVLLKRLSRFEELCIKQ
ncbi:hypothetical protein COLO4_11329 [Corchorus olitorius]|uniref:Protein Lines C-terminal domain-containing protein n=1 Tax=Corchorus olitorius TaxID=93759 RepID=A0A1R3K4W2_9ROSI|nr:hypothetical protein COLO4_11329 [Corchorus olitorius]